MKISVIIPVYNAAPYLRECLDSVLAQTHKDWEAICVDDGSSDGSAVILDEYAARDVRFRVIHQTNAGVSAARNRGLAAAKGDWVGFLDADDWLDARLYEQLSERISTEKGAELICYATTWESAEADQLRLARTLSKGDDMLADRAYNSFMYCVWDKLFKKDVLFKLGLRFDERVKLSEDTLFVLSYLSRCGISIVAGDIGGYHYRKTPSGATNNVTRAMLHQQAVVCEEAMKLWLVNNKPGLLRFVNRIVVGLPFLGKIYGLEMRLECVEFLLKSEVFARAIGFMLFYGTMKSRAFALMYRLAPRSLKRKLLLSL